MECNFYHNNGSSNCLSTRRRRDDDTITYDDGLLLFIKTLLNNDLLDNSSSNLLIEIENSDDIEKLSDNGYYDVILKSNQISGDVSNMQQVRIKRLARLIQFNFINKSMREERELKNLLEDGMWGRAIDNSSKLDDTDKESLRKLRELLSRKVKEFNIIKEIIIGETRQIFLSSNGRIEKMIFESTILDRDDKLELNNIRIHYLQMLNTENQEPTSSISISGSDINKSTHSIDISGSNTENREPTHSIDISGSNMENYEPTHSVDVLDSNTENHEPTLKRKSSAVLESEHNKLRLRKREDHKKLKRRPFIVGRKKKNDLWNPINIMKPAGEILDPDKNINFIIDEYKKSLLDSSSISEDNIKKIRNVLRDHMINLDIDSEKIDFLEKITKILINGESDDDLNFIFDTFDFDY
jgi:hypothetical protein